MAPMISAAATIHAGPTRAPNSAPLKNDPISVGDASASSISMRATPISGRRLRGSFSRQRRSSRRTGAGVEAGSASRSGSRSMMRATIVGDVLAVERASARQHLVEHAAERPDVGALVDGFARAPVRDSCRRRCRESMPAAAGHRQRRRHPARRRAPPRPPSSALARPKSSTLTVPSGAQLDVGGLQIAVDDAVLVRGFERVGDLPRDRQRFVERQRSAARCGRRASGPRRAPARAHACRRCLRGRRSPRCADD